MRITNNLITSQLSREIARNLERLAEVQNRGATARRLNKPSDDPVGAGLAVSFRSTITALEQFQRSAERAEPLLAATRSTLDGIRGDLTEAKALAIQGMGDPVLSAQDRQAVADQANQLLEDVFGLSQTKFADRYLFGGIQITSAPFTATRDASGKIVSVAANPQGISGTISLEVLEGLTLIVNTPGDEVFQKTVDLFQILINLRNDLEANNTSGTATHLANLDAAFTQVLDVTGDVGARLNRLEAIKGGLGQDLIRVRALLSQTEDADITTLFVELNHREQVFQASLAVAARLIQPSLMDFLR